MHVKLMLNFILIGIVLLFVIQNVALVNIRFFLWHLSLSGALLFILLFTFGTIFGWFFHSYALHRKEAQKKL